MQKSISKLLLIVILTTLSIQASYSQNFGFSSSTAALSNVSVKANTNVISTEIHVYFIAAVDSKIYDIVWNGSTWVPSSAPLGGASCPAVKNGTNFVNFGEELYFVSAVNSQLYRLKWTPASGWQPTIVHASSVPVAGNKIVLKTHPTGCEIYYIGTGGKICQAYYNGTWGPGAQLTASQTVNAVLTSPLVAGSMSVFYVGSTDNKIHRVYWGGSSWTGGNSPIVASSTPVRTLSNVVYENNNPDHLYYINTSNLICELAPISGSWTYSLIPMSGNLVMPNTDIVCSYGSVFYGRSSGQNICRVWKTGSWNHEVLPGPAVAVNSQLFVWANDIIEEGTINTTFKSFHVFYVAVAPFSSYKVNMLVYDDKRVPFNAFGCYDACDNNANGTGHDNPLPNTAPNIVPGYDCSLYNVGGIKPKEWYYGAVPAPSTGLSPNNIITVYNKHFYFVSGSRIHDFLRTQMNGETRGGYLPSFQDEFNDTEVNPLDWLKTNYSNPFVCYDEFWNFPANATESEGTMEIVAHNATSDPHTLPYHGVQSIWVEPPSCFYQPGDNWYETDRMYDYSSALVTTGDPGKPQVQFGYLESRFKVPRGKGLWPTFFFFNGSNKEDINFEFQANGKSFITTLYHPTNWYPAITTYAVGYRFYDDFYTYAVDWPSNGNPLVFYLNNQVIGALPNDINPMTGQKNCVSPHNVIYSLEIDNEVHAMCEPAFFPAYYQIDYFRAWGSTIVRSAEPIITPEESVLFTIYPNPATNTISISGDGFMKAEIFNVQGGKVMEESKNTIDIESLSKGIYMMRITNIHGGIQNTKFIKE